MTNERHDNSVSISDRAPMVLHPSGVLGLDEVLGGGIQRGSLVIIAGPPGSGKTILAHHIAFSAARTTRRTTVLTAFSEPTNKLIAHMRPFAFFDQDLVGQTLDVLSIQQFLRQGMESAADEIVDAVRTARASLVVLDGFRGVRETAERPEQARQFIYDVSNRLSLLGITLVLTSEANVRDVAFFPEATTADVLLGLAFDAIDARERRTLEVLKVRGAAPLAGRHAMTIGNEGVIIYPRLEARIARLAGTNRPLDAPRAPVASSGAAVKDGPRRGGGDRGSRAERVSLGVPGLDPLLGGGLMAATSTLVVGARGAGKTLFGLQFAAQGVQSGEPGLFVTFRETTDELLRKVQPFQWRDTLRDAFDRGKLTVLHTPAVELNADALADNLLTLVDRMRARRLVLDEIGEVEHALAASGYTRRFRDFAAALVEALRLRNVTSLLTRQAAAGRRTVLERELGPSVTLTENLLWLRQRSPNAETIRTLAILQMARSARADTWHRVTIQAPRGIAVDVQTDGAPMSQSANMIEDNSWAIAGRDDEPRQPNDSDKEGRDDDA